MKNLFILIILVLFLPGCIFTLIPNKDYLAIQIRLAQLEKKVQTLSAEKAPRTAMLLAEEAGARKAWWRNARTGGGDALDGIDDSNLTDGDFAIVPIISGTTVDLYFYIYDSDGASDEDNPRIIKPDTGTGNWLLCDVHASSIESDASGDAYILVNNSATPSTPSEGWIWYDTTDNRLEFYDGTNTKYLEGTQE